MKYASNTDIPKVIKNEDVFKVYKIDFPKCKEKYNHKDCINPHCLIGIKDVNPEPNLKLRKPNTFVGLKNLGSTCYINSLLQLWFHNVNIRNAILSWDPIDDENEKQNQTLDFENAYEPMTPIGHVQSIFALMQFGNQPIVDPTPLVAFCNINVSLEEDSEEFQNYLLTLIQEQSNSESNVTIQEMVKNNFFGEYNSVITCVTCKTKSITPSQFGQIYLNVKDHRTLTESLQEYFREENMTGDEKYFCTKCNEKQNAVRQIVITSLPHLIHLKLMRYMYDNKLMRVTKLNMDITCPFTIDMSDYLDESYKSPKENYNYELYGVLVHRGHTPNVGHYITHIKDLITEEWYEMNDEHVKMLNINSSNLHNVNILKGFTSNKPINHKRNEFKTNDAYMLVYINASIVKKIKTEPPSCAISPRLAEFINTCNNDYTNKLLLENENENINYRLPLSNLIREIKSTKIINNEGDAISGEWLESLSNSSIYKKVGKINNRSIVCVHNKLNPDALDQTKYIGTKLADKLYDLYQGGPRLRLNSSLCEPCAINKYAVPCMRNLTNEHRKLIFSSQKMDFTSNHLDKNFPLYWLGIKSYEFWPKKYVKMFQYFLKYNNILPNAVLPINQEELVFACQSLIGILDDTVVMESSKDNSSVKDYEDRILIEPDSDDAMDEYFKSLENLRSSIMSTSNINNNHLDNIFPEIKYKPWTLNEEITCPHGNLCIAKEIMILVPEEVKNLFQIYFPNTQFFVENAEPCSLCTTQYKAYLQRSIFSMEAILQESFLNTLVFEDTKLNDQTQENIPYFCITKDFIESWREFVSSAGKTPKPQLINKSLLCEDHNELLFEPTSNFVSTNQSPSVIITKNEWLDLIDHYEADCGVFVYFDKEGKFQKSIPRVCLTCTKTLDKKKSQFNDYINAKIFIQVTVNNFKSYKTDNEVEVLGNSVKKFKQDVALANDSREYEATASSINIYNSTSDYGTRFIQKRMSQNQSIRMSSNDTVFLLKKKIEEVFNVLPANQFLKTAFGKPLIDCGAKLRDLKIYPESVIIAEFKDENEN